MPKTWYMDRLRRLPLAAIALLTIWCAAIGYGFWRMTRYDLTPGVRADSPSDWPAGLGTLDCSLQLSGGNTKTLVVFAHPQCPCTRATIGNIAAALAHESSPSDVRVYVAFYEPYAHAGSDWERSDLVRSAMNIPNVEVLFDPAGAIAHRFGAQTSGETLVYDAAGTLLFSGGVTDQRGQFGGSDGGDAIAAIAEGAAPKKRVTPVYGCSLLPAHAVDVHFASTGMPANMRMSAPTQAEK